MHIHHLNCMTMCPLGGALVDGHFHLLTKPKLVCHCLLIETERQGLVLVDTGLGENDVKHPWSRLSPLFRRLHRPSLEREETALHQIERLGFRAHDVRHIILTHLDFDHAGGLDDFPKARVHLLAKEHQVATERVNWLDRQRFHPQQWSSEPRWVDYPPDGERWFGFQSVRAVPELQEELLLIPLPGHTLGHTGVAIRRSDDWLLHCGDAYFYDEEMDPVKPFCVPGLAAYQTLMDQNRELRLGNQRRLRALARKHSEEVHLFCSHDPTEFERFRRSAEGGHFDTSIHSAPGTPASP